MMSYLQSTSKSSAILKILSSKRLLIDHLEVLEEVFDHVTKKSQSIFFSKASLPFQIGCIACLIPIVVTAGFDRSYILTGCVSLGSALGFSAIAYAKYNYERNLDSITHLITAFEQFDKGIRRIFIFINEIFETKENMIKLQHSINKDEMLLSCMHNCMRAVQAIYLYEAVLEERTKLHDRYASDFEPLENLDQCGALMQDIAQHNQKNAKKLFHVFLYMQSHCLLRLALAIASDETVLDSTRSDVRLLTLSLAECTETVISFVRIITEFEPRPLGKAKQYETAPISREIMAIKNQSLDLAVKLTAVTKQMVGIDDELQRTVSISNQDLLKGMEEYLIAIQANLLMRSDDCERLLISVNKLLRAHGDAAKLCTGDVTDADVSSVFKSGDGYEYRVSGETVTEPEDEFFVLRGTEGDHFAALETSPHRLLEAEELVTQKLMKKQFRPVLRQLRERLQPIEQSFREREKTVMKRKGIELSDDDSSETEDGKNCTSSDVMGIFKDEDDAVQHSSRAQNRYDKGRSLLASKHQINIFSCTASKSKIDENIFE